jgi:sulfoxide reductase catalytic subunit YedY
MTYDEVCRLPAVERNVLLICPGFFAYNGRWRGVDSAALISRLKPESGATHIKFSGPKGIRRKTKEFPLQEFLTNKVFLAYQVNGRPLPERHGFPVRLVAEDYYGGRWVKYVDRISFIEA